MVRSMTITNARQQLLSLNLDQKETIAVTKHGKPVYALMDWDVYESISETLDILSDPKLVEQLQRSMREVDRGELISHEDLERELG